MEEIPKGHEGMVLQWFYYKRTGKGLGINGNITIR
jgi:hypothetical protein